MNGNVFRRGFVYIVATAFACSVAVASSDRDGASGPLTATRIDAQNAERFVQQGPDATGGIGDWYLSNGTLCAVVSDPSHESDLSANGGVLVDLGFCDRADDQLVVAQDLLNGSPSTPVDIRHVDAAVGMEAASIVSRTDMSGLLVTARYTVNLANPTRLHVRKTIRRTRESAPEVSLYAPILQNYFSMPTFVLASDNPAASVGFRQVEFASRGPGAFTEAAHAADTIIALAAPASDVPIAYGWRLLRAEKVAGDEREVMPSFALSDAQASGFLVLSERFLLGDGRRLGTAQLLQVGIMGLDVDEVLELEEEFLIARSAHVSGITDQLFAESAAISGSVAGSRERTVILVDRLDGERRAPFSMLHPDSAGRYRLNAPAGDYVVRAVAPGDRSAEAEVSVEDGADVVVPDLDLGVSARLDLPRGTPMRLVFEGLDGTATPDLEDPLTGYVVAAGEEIVHPQPVPMVFLAGVDSDARQVVLPPGRYRVTATRGIEYELSETEVELRSGQRVPLDLDPPRRVVETPGAIAADLHVHSGPSMDNGFSTRERVRTFVAETGEVMVAAEHETLFDFAPLIREMGLEARLRAITGTEMTGQVPTARMPHTAGHANFFPLDPDPYAYRRGVPANEGRRLREIIHHARQLNADVVAQLNHARASDRFTDAIADDFRDHISNGAYLDHMGPAAHPFDPSLPLTTWPNRTLIEPDPVTGVRDLDVDAFEILNGTHDWSPTRRRALLTDWYALLRQGERLTGTANSDSHGKSQQVGLPRNMITVSDDDVASVDEAELLESIRRGRLVGTTGPLLDVRIGDAGLGDMSAGAGATLEIRAYAAEWVPMSELRVLVNGEVVHRRLIGDEPAAGLRREVVEVLPLRFDADAFVTVEVEGEPDERYSRVYPGQRPYAFSNPIYVDADSDGQWQPPGLANGGS